MEKAAENKQTLYMVMRLNTQVDYLDPRTGKRITTKLEGLAGFVPVFETREEAEEDACNGKYEIVEIEK